MSNLTISAFCNFIEHIIIPDNNTYFRVVDYTSRAIVTNDEIYQLRELYTMTLLDISCIGSVKAPNISIRDFIKEIFKSDIIHPDHFNEVILYVVNILNYIKTKGIYLNYLTSHRLIVIILLLACKITDDRHFCNIVWSKLMGITLTDINTMEITILKLCNFNLSIIISKQKALAICKSIY